MVILTLISPINHLMPGALVYIQEYEDDNVIDVVWNGEPNQIHQAIDKMVEVELLG